jgi:hypothetical protein
MTVDVIYQGLPLVKAANARSEGGGLFVELEAPMPVGTRLEIVSDGKTQHGRVESVSEGAGSGMLVGLGEIKKKSPEKSAEPNAPMAEMKSAPPVQVAPAEKAAAEKDEEEEDDKPDDKKPSGGSRRSKRRKTVIGH